MTTTAIAVGVTDQAAGLKKRLLLTMKAIIGGVDDAAEHLTELVQEVLCQNGTDYQSIHVCHWAESSSGMSRASVTLVADFKNSGFVPEGWYVLAYQGENKVSNATCPGSSFSWTNFTAGGPHEQWLSPGTMALLDALSRAFGRHFPCIRIEIRRPSGQLPPLVELIAACLWDLLQARYFKMPPTRALSEEECRAAARADRIVGLDSQ